MRNIPEQRKRLLEATMLGVDKIVKVLKRPIDTKLDDDKLKSAVDAKSQAIESVNKTLLYIDESDGDKDFLLKKVNELIDACWFCFDTLVETVLPNGIDDDLEDNRMKNAIIAKDVARDTCELIMSTTESMQKMVDSGKIELKKHLYVEKGIEKRARNIT